MIRPTMPFLGRHTRRGANRRRTFAAGCLLLKILRFRYLVSQRRRVDLPGQFQDDAALNLKVEEVRWAAYTRATFIHIQ
jgi:hypothetical protein